MDGTTEDTGGPIIAAVDHGAPLWRAIEAGRYRYADVDITDGRFREPGEGVRTLPFAALGFGALPDGEAVLPAIAALGVRPATFIETLAVGAARPDLPGSGILAALGSIWTDDRSSPPRRYAAVIQRFDGRRYLDLQPLCFPWKPEFLVLVTPFS